MPTKNNDLVKLDWRFHICSEMTRIELEGVKSLHDETEIHFGRKLRKLRKEIETLSAEELSKDRGDGFTLEDHYQNDHEELIDLKSVRDDASRAEGGR